MVPIVEAQRVLIQILISSRYSGRFILGWSEVVLKTAISFSIFLSSIGSQMTIIFIILIIIGIIQNRHSLCLELWPEVHDGPLSRYFRSAHPPTTLKVSLQGLACDVVAAT